MFCNNCGASIDDNSRFCLYCGQQIDRSNFNNNMNENSFEEAENQYEAYKGNNQQYNEQQSNNINDNKPKFVNTLSYEPIGMWGYFGYEILFTIPIIGFILMVVFSISSNNINVRNFSRAYLVISLIGLILLFIICSSMGITIFNIFNRYY